MASIMAIKNKVTGKESTVTSDQWEQMEEKKRGSKLFTIVRETPMRGVRPVPEVPKEIKTPPEAGVIIKKKRGGADAAQTSEQDA